MNSKMQKNLNIYFQCLFKSYHNEDIEPLIEVLYTLVEMYDEELNKNYDVNGPDANLIRKNKSAFIETLIDLFTKLIKNDDIYFLKDYIHFSFDYGAKWYDIEYFLYALIYPKDFYKKNNEKYYEVFKTLASNVAYKSDDDNYPLTIQQYLDEYKKYYSTLEWIPLKDFPKKLYFNYIMSIMIANFYVDDVTHYKIPRVVDYVFNNLEYIRDFLNTNGIDNKKESNKLKEILVSKILSNIEDDKREIK